MALCVCLSEERVECECESRKQMRVMAILAYRLTVGVDELFTGSTTAMAMGGTTLLHCGTGGDDRTSHLTIPSGALAPSINAATLHSGLSNIGPGAPSAWPPTLWQYPTTGEISSGFFFFFFPHFFMHYVLSPIIIAAYIVDYFKWYMYMYLYIYMCVCSQFAVLIHSFLN